jgi:hypothetical protein
MTWFDSLEFLEIVFRFLRTPYESILTGDLCFGILDSWMMMASPNRQADGDDTLQR